MAFPRSIVLKITVVFAIGALSLSAQAPANAPGRAAAADEAVEEADEAALVAAGRHTPLHPVRRT